jgi:hypothetical protein
MSFLRSQTVLDKLISRASFESEGALMLMLTWSVAAAGSAAEDEAGSGLSWEVDMVGGSMVVSSQSRDQE